MNWFILTARCFIASGCLLSLTFGFCAMWGCDRVFYYPDGRVRGTPDEHDLPYEDVFFTTADGFRLHGWFLPSTTGDAHGTVLHLHGNAANITGHYEFVRWLPAAGYNVFVFDYRGYGRSGGAISREGSIRDAEAALDYLRGRGGVDAERILAFGQSLGGAVAVVAAAQRPGQVRGLVVEGAFTRYRDVARYHVMHQPLMFMFGWWYPMILGREFDPIDQIARVSPTPLLILHGENDRVVPVDMARALFERAGLPKELWIVPGMDHYQAWEDRADEAREHVLKFFEAALTAGA